MKKFFKYLWVFSNIIFFLSGPTCFALEQKYPSMRGATINADTDLPGVINYFFNFAMMGGGIAAMVIITIAGFRWVYSAADVNQKKEAMEDIKAGFFGLILLLASFLILSTINPDLVNLQMPTLTR
jgi:hypothetical protein